MFRNFLASLCGAVLIVLLSALSPHTLSAQDVGRDGVVTSHVAGTGVAIVHRAPTLMQIRVDLVSRASDLKTALQRLKDRREAARVQLDALKANADSVKIGEPQMSAKGGAQSQQMQMMIRRELAQRGGEVPTMPTMVTVKAELTAEWTLTADTTEAMMLAANALQKKLRGADLGGAKDEQELTPEQEEMLEEMQDMANRYGEQAQPEGEPHFLFVAHITDEQRTAAVAEAFGKAKVNAEDLAKAAGAKLGKLVNIRAQSSGMPDMSGMDYGMQQSWRSRLGSHGQYGSQTLTDNKGYAMQPMKVDFTFYVSATFQLEP